MAQSDILPASAQTERALLGAVLIGGSDTFRAIEELVGCEDFGNLANRYAFAALVTLAADDRPIDIVTLQEEIRRAGRLGTGGGPDASYLAGLLDGVPDVENAAAYARIVREAGSRRMLRSRAQEIAKECTNGVPLAEIVSRAVRLAEDAQKRVAVELPNAVPVQIAEALKEDEPELSWLIEPVLPAGGVWLVTSEGGVGKSTLIVQIAAMIAAGHDNVFGLRVPQAVPVLILEAEGSRHIFKGRVNVALHNLGIDPSKIPLYIQPQVYLPSLRQNVQSMIEACGAKLCVLDTVGLFEDYDENSNSEFKQKIIRPLHLIGQATGCAFVIVHHLGKPSDQRKGRHKTRGASAHVDDVEVATRLEAPDGDKASPRLLVFDKVKHGPPIVDPISLSYDFSTAVFTQTERSTADEEAREEGLSRKKVRAAAEKIVDALRRNPEGLSGRQMREATMLNRDIVAAATKELQKEFLVYGEPRTGRGAGIVWKLGKVEKPE